MKSAIYLLLIKWVQIANTYQTEIAHTTTSITDQDHLHNEYGTFIPVNQWRSKNADSHVVCI